MLTATHIQTALKAAGARTTGLVMPPEDIANAFNEAILNYGDGKFTTIESVAALVSECMMESAYFRTTEEYAKNGRYAPYIGRSFIQVTWRDNYRSFGKWCKAKGLLTDENYFVTNPKRLADLKWAALGGVWYFTSVFFSGKPLVAYAGNIDQVGKAVNMGSPFSDNFPNGYKARRAAYAAVRKAGNDIVPKPLPTKDEIKAYILEVLDLDGLVEIEKSVITGNPNNPSVGVPVMLDFLGRHIMDVRSNAVTKSEVQSLETKLDNLLVELGGEECKQNSFPSAEV